MNKLSAVVACLAITSSVFVHGQTALTGEWQGTTGQGREVRLDLKATKQQLTGTLTIDQQPADISDGKIAEKTFSFTAPMGGRAVTFTGELVGDDIELIPQGARNSVTLKRVRPEGDRSRK
jgi:hypothetical protein